MTEYIRLETLQGVQFSDRWRNSDNFKAYGKFINKKGEFVKANYEGALYQLYMKKERKYTLGERVVRAVQGVFLNILTLGFCNFNKYARKLFSAEKKVLRFALRVINPKPVILPQELIARLNASDDILLVNERKKPISKRERDAVPEEIKTEVLE